MSLLTTNRWTRRIIFAAALLATGALTLGGTIRPASAQYYPYAYPYYAGYCNPYYYPYGCGYAYPYPYYAYPAAAALGVGLGWGWGWHRGWWGHHWGWGHRWGGWGHHWGGGWHGGWRHR